MPGGLHPPLSVILTWKPNYHNPETRGMAMVILIAVLLSTTYFVVGLRLWARFKLAKNAGMDDLIIIFNLIPLTGLALSLYLAFTKYGYNKHIWDIPMHKLVGTRKITLILETFYMLSSSMTKISILLFYRRLAHGTISNRFLYAVYAAIAFVIAYYITFNLTLYLHCRPFHAFWKQADLDWYYRHQGKFTCASESADLIAASVVSITQDFIAVGFPMVLFWRLRVSIRQRFALAVVFGVGIFVGICGIFRLLFVIKIYYRTYDMTWESYWAWIWFVVEAHAAVICASAPALYSFFKQTLGAPPMGHKKSYSDVEGNGPWLERSPETSMRKGSEVDFVVLKENEGKWKGFRMREDSVSSFGS